MKKHPSKRQIRYAYGLMNEDKTRRQIAIESGYSASSARVPKLIENKVGFKLAVAQFAGETGNLMGKLMTELQVRDLSKFDNKTLIYYLEAVSKTHERLVSKLAGTD
ncbi:MAG: hypothetical protein WCG02_02820 [Candidatus Taylorbacteria bacterium]